MWKMAKRGQLIVADKLPEKEEERGGFPPLLLCLKPNFFSIFGYFVNEIQVGVFADFGVIQFEIYRLFCVSSKNMNLLRQDNSLRLFVVFVIDFQLIR